MKPKILIFSTAYFPYVGGAEVAIKEITDRLSGFEFDVITARLEPHQPPVEQIGRITVYRAGFGLGMIDKLLLPWWGTALAWQLQSKYQYKLFWAVMVTFGSGIPYLVNILRRWLNRDPVSVILTLQEGDSEKHLRYRWLGLIHLAWKLALRRTDYLTVISQYLGSRAKQFGYAGELQVIPNGVGENFFSVQDDNRDPNLIVTASRLVRKNGLDTLIQALALLPSHIKLAIAGSGKEEANLRHLVKDLNLAERVEFRGQLGPQELPNFLSRGSIFARPSRSEGLGNAFLEAMAAGLPVIGTPVGGIPDFLKEGETGWLVPPDSPSELADRIRYLGDPSNQVKVEVVCKQARGLVAQEYTWDSIAGQMGRIFARL